jgi:ABC-2 type transport system ATP-binding protein
MIEVRGLTKRYGEKVAVDDLSFSVEPGKVTGFLGPNGAGKTTTMRVILGLDYPNRGTVTVKGKQYRELDKPMREVGALLDAKAVHGGRSAYNHLLCLAQTNNIPRRRIDEVLSLVGLTEVAKKRSKGFSLGMGQRLGIAGALLGDPSVLMFDEPVNGLDPEGIRWIRNLMKTLAAEGRTVFVSSHLMSVRTPQIDVLAKAVAAGGGTATSNGDGSLLVQGLSPERVGDIAFDSGVRLHELAPARASLEQAFMELTADSIEYQASAGQDGQGQAGPGAAAPVQQGSSGKQQVRAGEVG